MVPLVYSAGPNNLMCAASGAQAGFKNTLPFIAGVNTSLLLVSLMIGLGIGRITTEVPGFSRFITIAGSIYLLFLAFKLTRAGSVNIEDKPVSPPAFRDGFILNTLNPKGIVGLSIMFNEFIITGKVLVCQVLILSVLTVAISSSAHFLWAASGKVLSSFVKSQKAIRIQGYIFGILLAGVAIWMLFY
jgi:threonine/homoserine/homoserine lactone efflux protein